MAKQEIVGSKCLKCVTREADDAVYKYSLYVRQSNRVASYKLPLYSIKIEMNSVESGYTEAESGDIFSDLGKASVFFDRLVENLATPYNLPYIIEDDK